PWEYPPSTMFVFGQLVARSRTLLLASMTPSAAVAKSSEAGYFPGYTATDFPTTCEPSASTNASPVVPIPGGSKVPRRNTTSTSGHGAADAEGAPVAGLSITEVVTTAAPSKRLMTLISTSLRSGAALAHKTSPPTRERARPN